MSFGGMTRQAPASFTQPQRMSANQLGVFLPGNMLMPVERGNPSRKFNDQDEYELSADNKTTLSLSVSMRVWATKVEVLTGLMWPKMKLREGVRRVTGQRFEYHPMPTTSVPKRGTVRLMSKSMSSFSLAISQKGIGSRFEGSALRSPYGPNLLALETEAYAESISIGMAINTAINMTNVAVRQPYAREGVDYNFTRIQQLQREMRLFAVGGRDHSRLLLEIDNIMTDYPQMDTVLVPNRWNNILIEHQPSQISYRQSYLYTMDAEGSNELLELISPDKVLTLAQMSGGRLSVHECPTFRLARGRSWQPLETISNIGEIYFMYPENNVERPDHYNPSSLNIFLYDEQNDVLSKQRWVDAIEDANIWDATVGGNAHRNPTTGYDAKLRAYVTKLNKNGSRAKEEAERNRGLHSHVYPVAYDAAAAANEKFFLPMFFGNLDHRYFNDSREFDTVISSIMQAAKFEGAYLHEMQGDIATIKMVQNSIQHEIYRPEFWAAVAKGNIDRSVSYDSTGRPFFAGQPTPAQRAADHNTEPLREWVPNRYGSLDPPLDVANLGMPAGFFNAAGIQTIANMPGHQLASACQKFYQFMSVLGDSMARIFSTSNVFSTVEMPVNMPLDDTVQLIMNVCFGPTAPIFLAAPLDMASSNKKKGATQKIRPVDTPFGTGLISNVVVAGDPSTAELVARLARGGSVSTGDSVHGLLRQNTDGSVVWRSASGIVFKLKKNVFEALLKPAKDGEDPVSIKAFVDHALQGIDLIASGFSKIAEITNATEKNNAYNMLYRLLSDLSAKKIAIAVRICYHLSKEEGAADFLDRLLNRKKAGTDKTALAEANKTEVDPDIVNAIVSEISERLKDLAARPLPPNTNHSVAAFQQLQKALALGNETLASNSANFNPEKYYLGEAFGDTELTDWLAFAKGKVEEATLAEVQDLWNAVKGTSATSGSSVVGVDFSGSGAAAGVREQTTDEAEDASVLSVITAKKYRTPLTMSWHLLRTLSQAEVPWILPGDHSKRFSVPLDLPQGPVPQEMWDLPQYAYSRGSALPIDQRWSDLPIFARVALASDAYARPSVVRRAPIYSAGPLGRIQEEAYPNMPPPAGDNRAHLPPETLLALRGDMVKNMVFAMGKTQHNFVLRLAAVCLLMTPHYHLETIKDLAVKGVRPLHGLALWRLRSSHAMGALFIAKAGIESGVNLYNGVHLGWAHDGNSDEYQTRVVLSTDAHVLKPDNHILIPNIQCRSYLGGHNARRVRNQEQLLNMDLLTAPSIMVTAVGLHWHEELSFPVSFKNIVPGMLEVTRMPSVADPFHQNFPESQYYADVVYGAIYGDTKKIEEFGPISNTSVEKMTFHAKPRENHLAMRGYHLRYDYHHGIYCKEIQGNGHRAEIALNRPGAAHFLNGITSKLHPSPLANHLGLS